MRRPMLRFASLLTGLLVFASCDFPADPPLKTLDGPITPPVADTVRTLLRLNGNEKWTYIVDPRNKPLSSPRTVSPRKLEKEGLEFHYLPYFYVTGGFGLNMFAFPSLLRNDTLGLAFYQPLLAEDTTRLSRLPKFMFRLPYPARKGSISHEGDYRVVCTHTDTIMTVLSNGLQIPTHRYEVWRGSFPTHVFYVIPGVALLRIVVDDLTFHTVGWTL
jgi:hypothetical protein